MQKIFYIAMGTENDFDNEVVVETLATVYCNDDVGDIPRRRRLWRLDEGCGGCCKCWGTIGQFADTLVRKGLELQSLMLWEKWLE